MKCCYICRWYTLKDSSGSPSCGRHAQNPMTEELARKPESLKAQNCYQASKTQQKTSGAPTFERVSIKNPKDDTVSPLYCCCPGLLDALRNKYLAVEYTGDDLDPVHFRVGTMFVSYCFCCGQKLQTVEQMNDKVLDLVRTRRRRTGNKAKAPKDRG